MTTRDDRAVPDEDLVRAVEALGDLTEWERGQLEGMAATIRYKGRRLSCSQRSWLRYTAALRRRVGRKEAP